MGDRILRDSVLGVCHIDIRNDIDNSAISFLRKTFVLTAITGFHVKDRDMESLSANDRKATIGITKNKDTIGTGPYEELV